MYNDLLDLLTGGWKTLLGPEKQKPYFGELLKFLNSEVAEKKTIYPERAFVLRALHDLAFEDVKVVILGQDPYHGPEQAIGYSFSVPDHLEKKPPSLRNIFKELQDDLKIKNINFSSSLKGWQKQGVLLLNTVLTVEARKAFSHRKKGWETFTDTVITKLNGHKQGLVFILWGAAAQKKAMLINEDRHFVIKSVHPSPLSSYRGFFGSKPFSQANHFLGQKGRKPIDWAQTT